MPSSATGAAPACPSRRLPHRRPRRPPRSAICPACGAGNVPGEAFCDFCGSPLAAPVPEPAPAPVETPAAPEAEAAAAPVETPAAPAEQGLTCPACQAPVLAGEVFCANCGASLAQAPLPPEPVPEAAVEAPPSPLVPEPVTPPVPEPVTPPAPEAAPPPVTKCPVCSTDIEPGDTFCSNCGASLKAAPAPAPEPAAVPPAEAAPPPPSPAAVGPRLVVVASGAEIPLPAKAEILIGREDPVSGIFPDVDMTPHGGDEGGISRRHATDNR